jgi:hypothetical protein
MTKALFLTICLLTAANLSVAATSTTGTPSSPTPSADPLGIINKIYQFALLIGGLLAFGAIVYGGIKYILAAGNPSGQTEGRDWIKSALLGLLLLMGAYLVLNAINPNLTKLSLPGLAPIQAPTGAAGAGAAGGLSDTDARTRLTAAGISLNSTTRTSLQGIQQSTINEAISLKQRCDAWTRQYYNQTCEVQITGGTEGGHAAGDYSHANGYKIDLGLRQQLTEFIEKTYCCGSPCRACDVQARTGYPIYRSPAGVVYVKEGNHWDILVR